MKIDIRSGKLARSSLLMTKVRLVAGFTLAPTIGALGFYILINVPLLFGYELTGVSLSTRPSFLIGGLMTAGTLFYAPVVIIGLIVMLLIQRYRSWNIVNCIGGGLISALVLSTCFMALLLIIGSGINVAGGSALMMLGLITIPSVFSGMSFWVLVAYRNGDLEQFFSPHSDQNQQPVTAGNIDDIIISSPVQTGKSDDNYILKG
jgi:hypothetical protein